MFSQVLSWMGRLAVEFACGGNPDHTRCPCHGRGWVISPVETATKCPYHYMGQPHPEVEDGDEMWEYSLVEHVLDTPDGDQATFQVLSNGRKTLVNVYHTESSECFYRRISPEVARKVWRTYKKHGLPLEAAPRNLDREWDQAAEQECYQAAYENNWHFI